MNLATKLKPAYYEDIEDQIEVAFLDLLFMPILRILVKGTEQMSTKEIKKLFNSDDDVLRTALRFGKIQYADGIFSGIFAAATSRALRNIGAKFDDRQNVFRINPAITPEWIKQEAGFFQETARTIHKDIKRAIDHVQESLDLAVEKRPLETAPTVDGFIKDFRSVAEHLQIPPDLTDVSRQRLVDDYRQNMKLWIKKFSAEEIVGLRKTVEKNAETGYRFDRLIEGIRSRYEVSKSKAKFLARQETALFMSKFRRERFKEAGVERYTWSTSHDERVRDQHKHLDGKEFFYGDPPVVDVATGRRANPGEDFNCRCVDIPMLTAVMA